MNIYEVIVIIDSPAHNVPFFDENRIGYKFIDYTQRELQNIKILVKASSPEEAKQKAKDYIVLEKGSYYYDVKAKLTEYLFVI